MIKTDAIIIGAGPVGLFTVHQLGIKGLKAEVIDNPFAGGLGPIPQADFDAFYMSTDVPERVHIRGVLMRAAITYTFH